VLYETLLCNHAKGLHEHFVLQTTAETKLSLYRPEEAFLSFMLVDTILVVLPGSFALALEMCLLASLGSGTKLVFGLCICMLDHLLFCTMFLSLMAILKRPNFVNGLQTSIWSILPVYMGFWIKVPDIPWPVRWLAYINPARYAFDALMINEFEGVIIKCDNIQNVPCLTGDQVLDYTEVNAYPSTKEENMLVLLCVFVSLCGMTIFALRRG